MICSHELLVAVNARVPVVHHVFVLLIALLAHMAGHMCTVLQGLHERTALLVSWGSLLFCSQPRSHLMVQAPLYLRSRIPGLCHMYTCRLGHVATPGLLSNGIFPAIRDQTHIVRPCLLIRMQTSLWCTSWCWQLYVRTKLTAQVIRRWQPCCIYGQVVLKSSAYLTSKAGNDRQPIAQLGVQLLTISCSVAFNLLCASTAMLSLPSQENLSASQVTAQ